MSWPWACLALVLFASSAFPSEKITIGAVEDIILLPWGVILPARIDTGASMSSLDARELKIKGRIAEFRLSGDHGGLRLRVQVKRWQTVKSGIGRERRPVVEMSLCLGLRKIRTDVTLDDRSGLYFPFLVGREALRDHFVVDVGREKTIPPKCPEDPIQ